METTFDNKVKTILKASPNQIWIIIVSYFVQVKELRGTPTLNLKTI